MLKTFAYKAWSILDILRVANFWLGLLVLTYLSLIGTQAVMPDLTKPLMVLWVCIICILLPLLDQMSFDKLGYWIDRAAAPFARDTPMDVINTRVDEAFEHLLGEYDQAGLDPSEPLWMTAYFTQRSPGLPPKMKIYYEVGRKRASGQEDESISKTLHNIILPRGTSLRSYRDLPYSGRAFFLSADRSCELTRTGKLRDLSHHKRLSIAQAVLRRQ
jgi:hypothetical protein